MPDVLKKEALIREHLQHKHIKEIRGKGLMLAAIIDSIELTNDLILRAQEAGLILFWLLFEPKAIRITPPLTISNKEIIKGCHIIRSILDEL
jgi:acetylornithine aminotransferase